MAGERIEHPLPREAWLVDFMAEAVEVFNRLAEARGWPDRIRMDRLHGRCWYCGAPGEAEESYSSECLFSALAHVRDAQDCFVFVKESK